SEDRPVASRFSVLVAHLATLGVSPSALIGIRRALQRGSSRESVPVGNALVGMVLAVTALCGTGVFGASLSHLTATPPLYGEGFELNVTDVNPAPDPALLQSLEHDGAVTAITQGIAIEISIN